MTDPYIDIVKPIKEWCEKNYYSDFLVTIKVNDSEITEFLEFDPDHCDFVWHTDWWEGEKDVHLLGVSPIDKIKLHNYIKITRDTPAFHFTIDKDEDAGHRAFQFTKELYERIIEAQNLWLKEEIEANAVVINGRKYGMLINQPGFVPTLLGMKVETKDTMPDEWDFFLQVRPPQPQTNADRLRAMSEEELAEWMATIEKNCYARCGFKSNFKRFNNQWLDWLKDTVKEADE